jgi:hypothetical protein
MSCLGSSVFFSSAVLSDGVMWSFYVLSCLVLSLKNREIFCLVSLLQFSFRIDGELWEEIINRELEIFNVVFTFRLSFLSFGNV